MADIGTDHGFLPIYLVEKEISPCAVMGDVSAHSLEKGRKNAHMTVADMKTLEKLDFRVGDGLKVLESGEVDAVVIAGMGGKLIRDIMAADLEHTCSFKKFILQPRIGQGHLRKWLLEKGFAIVSEDLVIEGEHIPEIITVISPDAKGADADVRGFLMEENDATGDDILWKIPPWIVEAGGPVNEFLSRNIDMEKTKLENIKKAKKPDPALEQKVEENIAYLENLLTEAEDGK